MKDALDQALERVANADLLIAVLNLRHDAAFTATWPDLARPDDVIDGDVAAHRELCDDLGAIASHLLDNQTDGALVPLKRALEAVQRGERDQTGGCL